MTPSLAPPMNAKAPRPAHHSARAAVWAALVFVLAMPMLVLALTWQAARAELRSRAELHALRLPSEVNGRPAMDWPAVIQRRLDAEGAGGDMMALLDARGALVATGGGRPGAPTVAVDVGTPEGGRLRLVHSMRVPLAGTLALLVAGLAGVALLRRSLRQAASEAARPREAEADDATPPALRTLISAFHDGILLVDRHGRVQDCNATASRLLGVSTEGILGQPLARWIQQDALSLETGAIEVMARRGTPPRPFPCELSIAPVPSVGPTVLWTVTLRDLTARSLAERQLQRLANFDPLTGLPNRSLFRDRLRHALARCARTGQPMALMFLDLDRFKNINDSLGHDAGDQLLKQVAARLSAALRSSDTVASAETEELVTVARLGGDEFTIIAEGLRNSDDALRIAERVQQSLHAPVVLGEHEIVVSTSIGITVYPDDPSPPDDLLRHADQAMYRAKELGRDQVHVYSDELNDQARQRLQIEADLRHALDRGEFELAWQPKADLVSNQVSGVEALLRWKRDGRPVATPDVFIRVLEETGLILPVGRWVLEQAARQIVAWRRAGLPWLRVAVNLSARQLRQGDLVRTVGEVLEITGLPSAQLELELTESMLMGGEHQAQLLHQLSALGVQLAIDDFGTGWSSLSYLKRFNVDTLKIDRSFVRDTPHDPEDSAIAVAVISLARSLKLRVVAEGVETPEQRGFLFDNGCDEFQGWLLSHPMTAAEFEAWWRGQLHAASGPSAELAVKP